MDGGGKSKRIAQVGKNQQQDLSRRLAYNWRVRCKAGGYVRCKSLPIQYSAGLVE